MDSGWIVAGLVILAILPMVAIYRALRSDFIAHNPEAAVPAAEEAISDAPPAATEDEESVTGREMTKNYPVALVGESNYQRAIAAIGEGEDVVLWHEPDNPHDPRAIAAVCHGDTIGYLPRDHWLGRAVLDEGKGVRARIGRCERGASGLTGVKLLVSLDGDPVPSRLFEGA